ncbi:hypothetical protein TOPH_03969 [Tolypocladium ophioglossoides CBS 100239]|uniref:Uncharacterized protein n=1 Tax=Tolypocladium ophioglossoides (strain CBS 100239) TaxID=1163406 RepID=A0A0L0NBR5_TOLOC|nr:hypothetical protein TOPH_03969 [Tolypocladium ophioglossoides CBS 100239]
MALSVEDYQPAIVHYDASWPPTFAQLKHRIVSALVVAHTGLTSEPGLSANAVIDIDLAVPGVDDEASYAPQLKPAGFQFLLRERQWHGHRLFGTREPVANLHVGEPDSPEAERHRICREWLARNEGDRELYARVKRVSAERSVAETVREYNGRKEFVIREIWRGRFESLGTSSDGL